MASVVVTIKIMPESPETDLKNIEHAVAKEIDAFAGGKEKRFTIEPVAFGLKALIVQFVMPEEKGSTEPLEEGLGIIDGVQSVSVTDVRRTIG